MKKKTRLKQVVKTEEVAYWVAKDGTEFEREEDCKTYEETSERIIKETFNNLELSGKGHIDSVLLYDGIDLPAIDSDMFAVKIKNINDLAVANNWIATVTNGDLSQCLDTYCIGKSIILEYYKWDNIVYNHGTIEKWTEQFRQTLEKYFGDN